VYSVSPHPKKLRKKPTIPWSRVLLKKLVRGGLISLWLYKETNKLRDWKKMYLLYIFPLSSTQLWLLCSNFFNPSKKNSFGCVENRKSQRLISTPTYRSATQILSISRNPKVCCQCYLLHAAFWIDLFFGTEDGGDMFLRNVPWLSTDYMALYPRR
jgi:hypothetical protein